MSTASDLIYRLGVLHLSPTWAQLPEADRDAFDARALEAGVWEDLTDADRDLARQGALEVSAGASPLVPDSAEWGDWAAIDAAVESGDLAELDAALATIGRTEGGGLRWEPTGGLPTVTDEEADADSQTGGPADEVADDLEAKDLPGPDDTGWVGL